MSNNCLAGFPAFGQRVDSTVAYHLKTYTPESPIELPTSEPATAQVQFLIEAGDLPTFEPYPIPWDAAQTFAKKYTFYMWIFVQNTTAGNITLSYKKKTAVTPTWSTTATGSITANYYGTINNYVGIAAPNLGDTQEFKLWASGAGLNLIEGHMFAVPKNIGNGLAGKLLSDFALDISNTCPVPSGMSEMSAPYTLMGYWGTKEVGEMLSISPILSGQSIIPVVTSGLGSPGTPGASITTNATARRISIGYYPTRIAYTPIL